MKRERTLSLTVTGDEYQEIMAKMMEREMEEKKRITISEFLRETLLLPYLNGQPPKETPTVTIPEDGPKIDSEWNNL